MDDDVKVSDVVYNSVETWMSDKDRHSTTEIADDYNRFIHRKILFMIACIVMIVIVVGFALTVGGYDIPFFDCYQIIWNHFFGTVDDTTLDYIIMKVRLPRLAVGICAGCGLAMAGVVMQSILKNPLADPYTTGVSSGALFGATLAMTISAGFVNRYVIVMDAFVFSLIPTLVIIMVAKIKNASPTVMIMSGIAVMYIFNACTTVLKLMTDPNSLASIYEWQVGSLTLANWNDIPIMAVTVLIGWIVLQLLTSTLNKMNTGDDSARSMGVNVETVRISCLVVVAIMSAIIVSFTGLIGFVGLVSPHIARIFISSDNRFLLPASALFGAALLLLADLVGRTIIAPASLQVGVIMAFIGGPMFLWLIAKRNSKVWG